MSLTTAAPKASSGKEDSSFTASSGLGLVDTIDPCGSLSRAYDPRTMGFTQRRFIRIDGIAHQRTHPAHGSRIRL